LPYPRNYVIIGQYNFSKEDTMARKCYITGLGTTFGNNRPYSLKASRRKWKANLQKVRIIDEKGRVKRVYVSTRALRSGLVKRA
jgi:large subunit ribosomal protein L28